MQPHTVEKDSAHQITNTLLVAGSNRLSAKKYLKKTNNKQTSSTTSRASTGTEKLSPTRAKIPSSFTKNNLQKPKHSAGLKTHFQRHLPCQADSKTTSAICPSRTQLPTQSPWFMMASGPQISTSIGIHTEHPRHSNERRTGKYLPGSNILSNDYQMGTAQ